MVARLYDLIVHLLRTKEPTTEPCASKETCNGAKRFEFLESVCEYLEEHYAEPVKLDHVAEHIKFSKFHVCKLFKETKGVTLMEYLNHFRIIKSEWALLFSQTSILDIAIGHGFNNVNSYNRLFKNIMAVLLQNSGRNIRPISQNMKDDSQYLRRKPSPKSLYSNKM